MTLADYMTVAEAAEALGKSESHIRTLLRSTSPPQLTGQLVSKVWLVSRESVDKLQQEYTDGLHKPGPAADETSPTRREMARREMARQRRKRYRAKRAERIAKQNQNSQ